MARILETDDAVRVVAQASSDQEALAAVRAHRPDVVGDGLANGEIAAQARTPG